MQRRDFIRGLLALGVTAAVADKLAWAEGLGRVYGGYGAVPADDTDFLQKYIDDFGTLPAGSFRVTRTLHFRQPGPIVNGNWAQLNWHGARGGATVHIHTEHDQHLYSSHRPRIITAFHIRDANQSAPAFIVQA